MTDQASHGVSFSRARAEEIDIIHDQDVVNESDAKHHFSRVGTARPTTLFFTDGPGAIKDMPRFTVLPLGYDSWDRVWNKWPGDAQVPVIHAPRLLERVRTLMGRQVKELRPYPVLDREFSGDDSGRTMGVPAVVFPQWLRCTKCGQLAKISNFSYSNRKKHRPDLAGFEHAECPQKGKKAPVAIAARYLLVCANGHLDEFPYREWVHRFGPCSRGVEKPALTMLDPGGTAGSSARIKCAACGEERGMNEAQGEPGRKNLPRCRGRHPHLDGFDASCQAEVRLMLVGASNLWFPVSESVIVMPESTAEQRQTLADDLRRAIAEPDFAQLLDSVGGATFLADKPVLLRSLLSSQAPGVAVPDSDAALQGAYREALTPGAGEDRRDRRQARLDWDPLDLRVPEWTKLQDRPTMPQQEYGSSGLVLTEQRLDGQHLPHLSRLVSVDKLRKVQALIGFTRIDEFSRVDDAGDRLVRLSRDDAPRWTVATEDRGEGMLLIFDEGAVAAWETRVEGSPLWEQYRAANRRAYENSLSGSAKIVDPDTRLNPPRFWLLHTLSHVLMREMAMHSGYASASLSERLYAWKADPPRGRVAAAGLMICTTAADSDGTLGGLVALSDPDRLEEIFAKALRRAGRCSSDPICGNRAPANSEAFLHGAACHSCAMASETSCEGANRSLDRRMLLSLPRSDLGFFGSPSDWG